MLPIVTDRLLRSVVERCPRRQRRRQQHHAVGGGIAAVRFELLRDGKPRDRQPGEAARLRDFRDQHHIPHVHRAGHHHHSRVSGPAFQVKNNTFSRRRRRDCSVSRGFFPRSYDSTSAICTRGSVLCPLHHPTRPHRILPLDVSGRGWQYYRTLKSAGLVFHWFRRILVLILIKMAFRLRENGHGFIFELKQWHLKALFSLNQIIISQHLFCRHNLFRFIRSSSDYCNIMVLGSVQDFRFV